MFNFDKTRLHDSFVHYKIKSRILLAITFLKKNSVKLCLHLSYIAQNSFHFDEIFHRKFKTPILVLLKKFRETLFISTLQSTKCRTPFILERFFTEKSNSQFWFCMLLRRHLVAILGNIETKITLPLCQQQCQQTLGS